jgi:two-component system CitB family sensor kinase
MRRRLSLAAQIALLQLTILTVTLAVGAAVSVRQARAQLDDEYGKRVLAIAESVASIPAVRAAFDDPDPARTIQPLAEAVRRASGATFVVVANRDRVRYSHPTDSEVGKRLSTDPGNVLDGRTFIGIETGTLGTTVRAKVPVYDDERRVVGLVSVGILESQVSAQLSTVLPDLLTYLGVALLLGAVGSLLLARRVKRQTFGLEPGEIAALLEQREAVLHGLREGVLTLDPAGRVVLANDEARRLLDLPDDCVGRRIDDIGLPERLHDVLTGADLGSDLIVLRAGRVLVLNRMPIEVRGRDIGAVVTLRDRTELDTLSRELDGALSRTDALRAQAHEFSNRMHTVAGLLELGETDEAVRFIIGVRLGQERLADDVAAHVQEPAVAALLLAKSATAAERGAQLRISPSCDLPVGREDPELLVTVIGNLVDNALDALEAVDGTTSASDVGGNAPAGGWVEVVVRAGEGQTVVRVSDSGPGVAPELAAEVFRHGFTTKIARSGGRRGLGLALARQACVQRGGHIAVHNEGGAVFTAVLPRVKAPST